MREIARQTEVSMGRLLVVDDDLVQRSVIGKIGAKLGYDTTIASSFENAVAAMQDGKFDVMTVDLSLGERDGVELLRLVADRKLNSMPIVIISGCDERILNSTKRVAEGLRLNLINCLPKPLNLDDLREALYLPQQGHGAGETSAPSSEIDEERIRRAFAAREFFIEFQPKVNLQSGLAVGAEALMRWRSPDLGMVSPTTFIPRVEELGLMPELTDFVLREAISQGRKFVADHPAFTVAVNVPGSLMSDLGLPERIERILTRQNMSPGSLIVEVTESVAMADVDRAIDILLRLRLKGVGAAIDDFGTGYSSLSALARLPFSELKIDQSFVKTCHCDSDMMKIIEASVGLARAFKMKVVAEGIDSPEVLALVRQSGCDLGQGYLFSPALGVDRAKNWMDLRSRKDRFAELKTPRIA